MSAIDNSKLNLKSDITASVLLRFNDSEISIEETSVYINNEDDIVLLLVDKEDSNNKIQISFSKKVKE